MMAMLYKLQRMESGRWMDIAVSDSIDKLAKDYPGVITQTNGCIHLAKGYNLYWMEQEET